MRLAAAVPMARESALVAGGERRVGGHTGWVAFLDLGRVRGYPLPPLGKGAAGDNISREKRDVFVDRAPFGAVDVSPRSEYRRIVQRVVNGGATPLLSG